MRRRGREEEKGKGGLESEGITSSWHAKKSVHWRTIVCCCKTIVN